MKVSSGFWSLTVWFHLSKFIAEWYAVKETFCRNNQIVSKSCTIEKHDFLLFFCSMQRKSNKFNNKINSILAFSLDLIELDELFKSVNWVIWSKLIKLIIISPSQTFLHLIILLDAFLINFDVFFHLLTPNVFNSEFLRTRSFLDVCQCLNYLFANILFVLIPKLYPSCSN